MICIKKNRIFFSEFLNKNGTADTYFPFESLRDGIFHVHTAEHGIKSHKAF